MAYFIFLKYLDSLEDFRKNPHVKIPPKSPPTNFQSLGIFKNQNGYSENNFSSLSAQSAQRPAGPSGLSAQPQPIFFLFNWPSPPSPHRASASRSAQLALSARPTARRWCPALLPPPSWGNTSPHATFAPLHARLTSGPHLSSPSSGAARDPLRVVDSLSRHGFRAPECPEAMLQ
jgi:hypothetical protein